MVLDGGYGPEGRYWSHDNPWSEDQGDMPATEYVRADLLTAAEARIKMLEKRSDHYGVALMMIRAGCSDPARFAGNILGDKEPIDIDIEDELP